MNVTMIVDLQFGSTGKGLIAGYLAMTREFTAVVNANMPNAGHTYIDSSGRRMVHKVLPNGVVGPKVKHAFIGPGSVFNPDRLCIEVEQAMSMGYVFDVLIHPLAVPLADYHAELEAHLTGKIGSTSQGSCAALVEKMWRTDPVTAKDLNLQFQEPIYLLDSESYYEVLYSHEHILAEAAQGFSLGINEHFYPYCTSRSCDPSRFLSDMGLPWNSLKHVVGTLRTYPIRVGGNSGGWYYDQDEISWADIGVEPETTTVTGRERRIANFSWAQLEDAVRKMGPTCIFLNFCNYMEGPDVDGMVDGIEGTTGIPVTFQGWGPGHDDVIEGPSSRSMV